MQPAPHPGPELPAVPGGVRGHPDERPAAAVTGFVVSSTAIYSCPKRSLQPDHYRSDGTCHCISPVTGQRMSKKVRTALDVYARMLRARRRFERMEVRLVRCLSFLSADDMGVYHEYAEEVRLIIETEHQEQESS